MAGTEGIGFKRDQQQMGMKIDFIDVKRAYFHVASRRRVFVRLPPEDAEPGMCGLLQRSMYGTRGAAQNWEIEYATFMGSIGFKRGKGMPCIFHHQERGLRAVIHGDDFTILGHSDQLDWFRSEIQGKFEVKLRGRIGPSSNDDKTIRLLNRVFEWTERGILFEADQRHAEIIIKDNGLKLDSKGVVTPGVKGDNQR